jgi:hypothetical protein
LGDVYFKGQIDAIIRGILSDAETAVWERIEEENKAEMEDCSWHDYDCQNRNAEKTLDKWKSALESALDVLVSFANALYNSLAKAWNFFTAIVSVVASAAKKVGDAGPRYVYVALDMLQLALKSP